MNGLQVRAAVMSILLVLTATACGGGNAEPTPTATATATATVASLSPTATTPPPTSTPDPEAAVLAAYARYWDVYGQALRDRDESDVEEVMTGPRLDRAIAEIADLRNQDYAVALVVNSRPVVVAIDGNDAMLLDEYENQSYRIDPESKSPLQPTPVPGPTLRDRVTLQRVGETWKVVETVRQVSQ